MAVIAIRLVVLVVLASGCLAAGDGMGFASQNALVAKYCAVCHMDRAMAGGLSLQHFDAERAAPSLVAMMLSKLTGGVPLGQVPSALASERAKGGALNAAGIPRPDDATVDALLRAFAAQAAGAERWVVERDGTASVLREAAVKDGTRVEAYRLVVRCGGPMQLAWSPVAQLGSVVVSADGGAGVRFAVTGKVGEAAVDLTGLGVPVERLTVRDLFPGETVTFSFVGVARDCSAVSVAGAGRLR